MEVEQKIQNLEKRVVELELQRKKAKKWNSHLKQWRNNPVKHIIVLAIRYIAFLTVFLIVSTPNPYFHAIFSTLAFYLTGFVITWIRNKWIKMYGR